MTQTIIGKIGEIKTYFYLADNYGGSFNSDLIVFKGFLRDRYLLSLIYTWLLLKFENKTKYQEVSLFNKSIAISFRRKNLKNIVNLIKTMEVDDGINKYRLELKPDILAKIVNKMLLKELQS